MKNQEPEIMECPQCVGIGKVFKGIVDPGDEEEFGTLGKEEVCNVCDGIGKVEAVPEVNDYQDDDIYGEEDLFGEDFDEDNYLMDDEF